MNDNFSIKRQNIRTISLVICTLIYLLTGAAIFDTLESGNEEKARTKLTHTITKFKQAYNMSGDEFELLYKHIIKKGSYNRTNQWDFSGSFYFCTLTLTLIGYGHSTPQTRYGRLFCILYCLCGIPISLIMFQSVGERLNGFLRYALLKIKHTKIFSFNNKNVTNKDLIIIEFCLTIILVLTASYVFSVFEGWSYFHSFYYSFITLTTIGFGDFVPLQKNNYLRNYPAYVIFTILFIMTGLIILASSTNLLVLYLVNINSEEKLRKRMRLKLKKQEQMQKMLIGDVISAVNKQDVVTFKDEMPNLAELEDVSVCSCDDLAQCYQAYLSKFRKDTRIYLTNLINKQKLLLYHSKNKNFKYHFTILRQPSQIDHLSKHFDKSDYILRFMDKTHLALRRLAVESDFINGKIIHRRNSI